MRNSLRLRLTIIFISLATVPLLVVSLLLGQRNFAALSQQAITLQSEVARRVSDEVFNLINNRVNELTLLVNTNNIAQLDRNAQINLISGLLAGQRAYEEVSLLNSNGQEIVRIAGLKVFSENELASRVGLPEFEQPRATGQIYFGPVRSDELTGEPFIIVAVPSYDARSGQLDGVLLANLRFRSIWDLMSSTRLSGNGIVYLVDGENRVVAHRDPSVVLRGDQIELPEISGRFPGLENEDAILAISSGTLGTQQFSTVAELETNQALALAISNFTLTMVVLLVTLGVAIVLSVMIARRIVQPIESLALTSEAIAAGDLSQEVKVKSRDEIGTLATSFNRMTGQLRLLIGSLEERVTERTRDLTLASEVGQAVSQIRDVNELLRQAVVLIQERFDLYYAQIYLMDENGERLALRAGTGVLGQRLLAQGHGLPVDENSINGRAALHAQPVIVPDTQHSDFFRPNPALPETRSEMAVPLISGDRVVGVLDMQSSQVNSLNEAVLPAFETLTAQLAVAIQNADLLTEMTETTLFLDSIVANIPLILFVKESEELRYVRVSKGMEDLVGMPAATITGKNHYDFFPPDTAASFAAQDYEVLQNKTLVEVPEEIVEGVNGTVVLHTLKAPVLGTDGAPKYLIGLSTDITHRKQMETQLAERLKQLNLLNEIGRKAEEVTDVTEFMNWVVMRVPQTMSHPDECVAAITMAAETFGDARAVTLPRHMVEDLTVRGELVGRIHVAYLDETLNFRDEDSAIIGSVGRRVSSYIENQRLLAKLQFQAENLQKVAEISTAVAASHTPIQLMQDVAERTAAAFGLYQTAVFLLEEDQLVLRGAAGHLLVNAGSQNLRISRHSQKSLVARAVRTGQGVLVNDVTAEPDFMAHPLLPDVQAEIAVPLLVGEQVLGVLDVQSTHKNAFTTEDLNIFATLAFQVATSLQNARQYEQTQLALEELRSLQRVITGEGWQSFMGNRRRTVQGYVANRQQLQPIMMPSQGETEEMIGVEAAIFLPEMKPEEALVIPVQVRGATIGKLGVRHDVALPPQTEQLLTAIAQQVAEALERARLFEETELSRAQTDQLFAGSERVVRATTLEEIVEALNASTALQWMDEIELLFFDQPWRDAPPQTLRTAVAVNMIGLPPTNAVGTVYQLTEFPLTSILAKDRSLVINNVHADKTLDEEIVTFLIEQLEASSLVLFPLAAGDQWIGLLMARSIAPQDLTDVDVRQISSLVDQAATVVQSIRLIEETQARAQQEQILRRVSERVYTAVDAESVLRTAVQEVGRTLGLEAFIMLDEGSNGTAVKDEMPAPAIR